MNGVKRIRKAPPKINDLTYVLKECFNDYVAQISAIEHKINVVETNIQIVPFMENRLPYMRMELQKVKDRITQISRALESNCLNNSAY
jgi:hypothetical protein